MTRKIIAAVLALVLLLAACGTAGADPRKIETAADADEWIAAFLGEHPEELSGAWAMTPMMTLAAAASGGIAGLAKLITAALGTAEKISPAYAGTLQGYSVFYVPCLCSQQSADLILVLQDGAVAGLQIGPYTGTADEEPAAAFDAAELALPVPGLGELPGTLTLPAGDGPFPAVILLAGSGPCDRDETLGSLKPFRDIAEGLAAQGVAAYRFDKRTFVYGAELAAKKDATLRDEYLEDAVNAVQLLAEQDKIDPARIFVLGHSLGGNAIPAVARELRQAPVSARGYIMMAASPRPLDVLMQEQYDFLYSLLPEVTAAQQAEKDALFADLDRLQDLDALTEDDTVAGVYSAYWKWLAAYDILQAADEIREPVLLLQGKEDYQVTMEDFGLWQKYLGNKANWKMISYPGLTHLFTPGQKAEGSAAYARNEKVRDQVILDIASFIEKADK